MPNVFNHSTISILISSENDIIQVRGRPGMILTSKQPLRPLASQEEIEQTKDVVMESFYPLAPTIDLRLMNICKDNYNFPGNTRP